MTTRNIIILCLVTAVVSAGLTRYYFPQVKSVEVEKEVIHTDVQTVIHTVKDKNGTIDSTTTITDHSRSTLTDTKKEFNVVKNWLIGPTVGTSSLDFAKPIYGVDVNRRVLGPFYVHTNINTNGANIGLLMEF